MSEVEVRREIEALEARLAIIEERLGIGVPAPPVRARTDDAAAMMGRLREGTEQIARAAHGTGEGPSQHPPPPARDKITPSPAPPVQTAHQQAQPPRVPPTVPPVSTPAAVSARAGGVSTPDVDRERGRPSISLEALIGGKWMAWVGAIVIVIGAGFLAAYIDVGGLWGGLPEALKCGILAAFGGALLVSGEWVMRRVGRLAAVGLFAAGLGTLYITAYATAAWYHVLPEVGALGLLAIVALGGLALTARTRAQAIGVLSIAGGYLAPILMRGATTFPTALPLYLTTLLAVALTLSAVRPRPFRTLRYVALGAHALVGFFWVFGAGGNEWATLIVFGGLWWVMVTAEALVAAIRRQSAKGNAIATFLTTAWFVSIVTLLGFPSGEPAQWLGVFTASLAVLSGALALQFGTGLTALRDRPTKPIDVMTATLWLQAGILVPMAIAFQFDGYAQTIGWLVIGLVGIEMGRRLRSRAVDVFGLVVGGLGVARLALLDWWISPALGRELATVGSMTITGWSILALCAIAALLLAGMRFREGGGGWKVVPAFLTAVAGFGWIVVTVSHCGVFAATAAWVLGGAALIAAGEYTRLGERQRFARFGIILISFALLKWVVFDTLGGIGFGRAAQPDWMAIINPQFAIATLLAAALWWLARLRHARVFEPSALLWAPVVRVLIVLWGLSFEIDRIIALTPLDGSTVWPHAQLIVLMLVLVWGAGGTGMMVWGLRRGQGQLAAAGGALLFGASVLWLTGGTLVFRVMDGVASAMVIFNPQFVIGAALGAALAAHLAFLRRTSRDQATAGQATPGFFSGRDVFIVWSILIGAIGLWLGSIEIDRLFAEAPMAKQTGFSIFWTLYGLGLIVLGFVRNTAPVRYVGLGLLALTLVKVGLIDTAQLAGIYRPLSFIAVGLLLVATSIGYLKLTPRLLAMHDRME